MKQFIYNALCKFSLQEISKKELSAWAVSVMHDKFIDNLLQLEYLKYWGIITELASMDDMDDYYCEQMVTYFTNVLLGKESASFSHIMQIPSKYVEKDLMFLRTILKKYKTQTLCLEEVQEIQHFIQCDKYAIITVNDMLKSQLQNLLKVGYGFIGGIQFDLKSTLFVSEEVSLSLEKDILKKIFALLECYDGNAPFWIYTYYQNGCGCISLHV